MPTYQYICKSCNHELEELQSMSEPPLLICPNCKEATLARIMGGGSGLIFKGSGFYLTDYKGEAKKSAPSSEKKDKDKTESTTPATSGDAKPSPPPAPPPSSDSKKGE